MVRVCFEHTYSASPDGEQIGHLTGYSSALEIAYQFPICILSIIKEMLSDTSPHLLAPLEWQESCEHLN